ncbi:basic proline-rich protein-like [Struthio camelus]|uniref:basic proline-rich protein-like n=1 Tax=Struthio camelus TaxID=8801 RepID=UPI003603EF35
MSRSTATSLSAVPRVLWHLLSLCSQARERAAARLRPAAPEQRAGLRRARGAGGGEAGGPGALLLLPPPPRRARAQEQRCAVRGVQERGPRARQEQGLGRRAQQERSPGRGPASPGARARWWVRRGRQEEGEALGGVQEEGELYQGVQEQLRDPGAGNPGTETPGARPPSSPPLLRRQGRRRAAQFSPCFPCPTAGRSPGHGAASLPAWRLPRAPGQREALGLGRLGRVGRSRAERWRCPCSRLAGAAASPPPQGFLLALQGQRELPRRVGSCLAAWPPCPERGCGGAAPDPNLCWCRQPFALSRANRPEFVAQGFAKPSPLPPKKRKKRRGDRHPLCSSSPGWPCAASPVSVPLLGATGGIARPGGCGPAVGWSPAPAPTLGRFAASPSCLQAPSDPGQEKPRVGAPRQPLQPPPSSAPRRRPGGARGCFSPARLDSGSATCCNALSHPGLVSPIFVSASRGPALPTGHCGYGSEAGGASSGWRSPPPPPPAAAAAWLPGGCQPCGARGRVRGWVP